MSGNNETYQNHCLQHLEKKWMKTVSGSTQNVEQQMFEMNDKIRDKF